MTIKKILSVFHPSQGAPIPGRGMVKNEAGGYVWPVDDWTRLDRFLILGSESGTYYIASQQLTLENAEAVMRCVQADGRRVVQQVMATSTEGRTMKHDPALFALALAAGKGDEKTRQAALEALPLVARTGTHLFHFLAYASLFRGWGRGLRRAVARWYTEKDPSRLVYQAVKYRQRDGWSHRDALRLAHPSPPTGTHEAIFHWITQGWPEIGEQPHPDKVLRTLWAFERAQVTTSEAEIISLVAEYDLPWETLPTSWLASAQIWETLLPRLPVTALVRNLARLTHLGVLVPHSPEVEMVLAKLSNLETLQRARLHPVSILAALVAYAKGRGVRGRLTWEPIPQIVDALDRAFYLSFGTLEPTGKRLLLGLDVSGSMSWGQVNGVPGLEPRMAAGAMALITAAVESQYSVIGFDTQAYPLTISPRQRLDDVVDLLAKTGGGGTDCAQPILWAAKRKVPVDAFVILTDSQTWAGDQHPMQAIQRYRKRTGLPAKMVVVAMVANQYTLGNQEDAGVITVVGFDPSTPQLITSFIQN